MEPLRRDRYLTEAELLRVRDDEHRHELVAGTLLSEPLPVHRHDRTRWRLERALRAFVESSGIGEIFGEAGYLLARNPDTVRGPDLSFVSRERLTSLDDSRFFPGAPDLAIEILSPSNRPADMHAKVADYLAAGARLVWVVDPGTESVTRYRSILAPHRLLGADILDGEDVLPGFCVPVAAIFAP